MLFQEECWSLLCFKKWCDCAHVLCILYKYAAYFNQTSCNSLLLSSLGRLGSNISRSNEYLNWENSVFLSVLYPQTPPQGLYWVCCCYLFLFTIVTISLIFQILLYCRRWNIPFLLGLPRISAGGCILCKGVKSVVYQASRYSTFGILLFYLVLSLVSIFILLTLVISRIFGDSSNLRHRTWVVEAT